MKQAAVELLSKDVIETIRKEIKKNEGQEVAFIGNVDRQGIVVEVDVSAYGNSDSAPVILMDTLQGDVLLHNHPQYSGEKMDDTLRASEADIGLATQLANKKIGFYIIDNECSTVNVIYKPEPRVYLDEPAVESIFQDDGLLSRNISGFEPREEQVNLVKGMIEAINGSSILVSEAGTGTGKSLSYLIPASIWAVENKKRVIVSTQTINLQQQIANKDMLIVEKIVQQHTGKEVHHAVLIGKGNYLCKKKMYELIHDREKQDSLFSEEGDYQTTLDIELWSRKSEDGILTGYEGLIRDDIWEELACDSLSCTRKKCVYYGDCFYYRARLEAEKANVIIANHSLVFSTIDETSHRSTLPFFSGIVFDEAHHSEDVALKSMSRDFSVQSLLYQLRKLYSMKKDRGFGLMVLLEKKGSFGGYPEMIEDYRTLVAIIRQLSLSLVDFIFEGADLLKRWMRDSSSVGLDEEFIRSAEYLNLYNKLSDLFKIANRITAFFEEFAGKVKEVSTNKDVIDILTSIGYRMQGLMEAKSVFDLVFNTENEITFVKWIEVTRKNIKFHYSPLEVGDFLANSLFSRKDFTIFTSATLMINQKFDFFRHSIGLNLATNKQKVEMNFPSPYDYTKQAEIYILEEDVDHGSVTKTKIDLVMELCLMSEGGVLVLFTSYTRLKEMFGILKDRLINDGLMPIKQGDEPRDLLLQKMGRNPNVVLFATSSFWEGIDIQGDNLRCVIIEKLPFDSPADPIYKAKVKLMEFKDQNPFMNYSIPRAVLRLKQGMGRLIRSKSDKGVIAIMDNRIKTQRYGPIFLNSIPPAKIIYGSLQTIIREAETFFVNRF